MGRVAVIAGSGALPLAVAAAVPDPVYVTFDGTPAPVGAEAVPARLEQLGQLFEALHAAQVTQVCFAGAMARPQIDPRLLDAHALRLAASFPKGDDALLREVLAVFTEQGLTPVAAAALCPDLVLAEGHVLGAPTDQDRADAAHARAVLEALAPLDVGQAAVVAGGLVLGIETLQGTDALLRFVAETPAHLRRAKGVLVKQPKAGQDLRIDMPTIGPATVAGAAKAGLAGLFVPAGQVIVLDRPTVETALQEAGLFLATQ